MINRVDRRSQLECLKQCGELLKQGASVLFFPEGTRTKDGRMHAFKKGAFSVAAKAKVRLAWVERLLRAGSLPLLTGHCPAAPAFLPHLQCSPVLQRLNAALPASRAALSHGGPLPPLRRSFRPPHALAVHRVLGWHCYPSACDSSCPCSVSALLF